MLTFVVCYLSVISLFLSLEAAPIMGPAEIIIKHGGKCDLKIPTLIDFNLRYFRVKGKYVFHLNYTMPWTFSDEIGVDANVAVKKNGAWKPNFLVLKGDKVCTAVKNSQYEIFKLFAKSLNAPNPPSCPLPAGTVNIDYNPDMSVFQEKNRIDVLPYGELRLLVNMTRREDVIACFKYYLDVVPKKSKG